FLQPLVRDRADQRRPVTARGEPVAQPALQRAELQEQMAGFAELDVARARNRRPRLAKILGVEQAGAGPALVAAGVAVAAMRAGADDVAVGQEAAVRGRVGLADRALLDKAHLVERLEDLLGELPVRRSRAAREVVEGKAEAPVDVGLHRVLA